MGCGVRLHADLFRDHMMIMKARTPPRRAYAQVARAAAAEDTARRIIEAFLDLLMNGWFDDITLDRVAVRAGIAVPTIIRRFGGRDGLLAAAMPVLSAQIREKRGGATSDPAASVDRLIADYERTGDAVIRLLALAPRYPSVEQLTEFGREQHRQWVSAAFIKSLSKVKGVARERALDALVVATDVYTWKLLRRDLQRSLEDSAMTIKGLIVAATDAFSPRDPRGDYR